MIKVKFNQDNQIQIHNVTKIDFEHKQVFFKRGNIQYNMGFDTCELIYQSCFKDINNKYIFSGDILRGDTDILAVKYNIGDQFVVYNPKCCKECSEGTGCVDSLESFVYMNKIVQIIGNIYENPELLEEEC